MTTWTVPATVVRVIDADTVIVDLDLGWRVFRNGERIRVAGIDAPERGTPEGTAATVFARQLLEPGDRVIVTSQAKPSFERTVGSIAIVDSDTGSAMDYAQALLEAGHATRARAT